MGLTLSNVGGWILMCYLEPPDQIEVVCTECGEEEQVEHIDGAQWKCLVCDDTFSDGSDSDGSEFDGVN